MRISEAICYGVGLGVRCHSWQSPIWWRWRGPSWGTDRNSSSDAVLGNTTSLLMIFRGLHNCSYSSNLLSLICLHYWLTVSDIELGHLFVSLISNLLLLVTSSFPQEELWLRPSPTRGFLRVLPRFTSGIASPYSLLENESSLGKTSMLLKTSCKSGDSHVWGGGYYMHHLKHFNIYISVFLGRCIELWRDLWVWVKSAEIKYLSLYMNFLCNFKAGSCSLLVIVDDPISIQRLVVIDM